MHGPGGELLYVGKSVRVRSRLLSYFRAPKGEKAWELIRETSEVAWDYIPNEFAALVREMKLIQSGQPRFNVRHKRKRIYAFVKITREPAPRVVPVTRVAEDGATYYGPFPRVRALGLSVRELCQVLGLRDCPSTTPISFGDQTELFGGGRMPLCMRAELRTCLAPCCGAVTSSDYGAAVRVAHRFLEGRAESPLEELRRQMEAASARLDYEYAALLRDRLERLRRFRDELIAFRGQVEDLTFLYRVPGFKGNDRLYLIRNGRIQRDLKYPKDRRARVRVAGAIDEVYGEPDPGPAALRPEEAAEILLVAQWFRLHPEERRRTFSPERWIEDRLSA